MGSLIGLLLVLGLVALAMYFFGSGAASRELTKRERAELVRLRTLVDDLKETAWDHRELDSALATIVIDKIRESERRGHELGP